MPVQDVTGIVLAGGTSKRMGKDKGLCEYNGQVLVKYAIAALKPICNSIIISTNNIVGYEYLGYPIVVDKFTSIGPMGGIYSALSASSAKDNLILSCDTPTINTLLMQYILSNSDGYDIVVPKHGKSFIEPLAAYYSSGIIPTIKSFINRKQYKLMELFNEVKFKTVEVDTGAGFSSEIFRNLNTPGDLIL